MFRINPIIPAAILILSLFFSKLNAQCNAGDKTPISIGGGVTVTDVHCPQNGTITVNGVTGGGGGDYVYEIYDGPIIRGIQSQNIFAALLPGNYKIRVTGCNSTFAETTATVGNYFLEVPAQTQTFLSSESFKCNTVNNGKVRVNIDLTLPSNQYSDSQYYRLPLRYQVSTSGDPATGFTSSPYNDFATGEFNTTFSFRRNVRYISKFDTIAGLTAGTTYYIRITDQCGVFKTTSVTIPNTTTPFYTYDFQVKEPYNLYTYTSDLPQVKGNCVQWGELTIFSGGSPLSSIASSSTYAPITAVLKRQDNGQVIDTRLYQAGALNKTNAYGYVISGNNNLIFDSVPRVPVVLELTDQCGTVTTINAATPSVKPPFNIYAYSTCSNGTSYFATGVSNAAPSLPVRFKIYDNTNTLLDEKLIYQTSQVVQIAGTLSYFSNLTYVPSFGEYRIVYEDQCNMKDSIVFNFGPAGYAPDPTFNFNAYEPLCGYGDGVTRYNVDAVQTNSSPVSKLQIISGPAGVNYPRVKKGSPILTNVNSNGYGFNYQYYFDSLVAGTYQVLVDYGCSQQLTTSFNVKASVPGNSSGYLSFAPQYNPCSAQGSTVTSVSSLTNTDLNLNISDPAFVRITNAPLSFLRSISRSKDGSDPVLPFVLGNLSADNFLNNGLDTNALMVYPKYSFMNLFGNFYFPSGSYTFELYSKCTGVVLDAQSFTITESTPYSKPNLGASSGYICEQGTVKVVASPIGGRRPFLYQLLLASDPDLSHYSSLQSDSIFILPANTIPGTVYNLRAVDACNNSFTGQVVVNSFTGNLYLAVSSDCIGSPSKIVTGYVPGATYTWTKPDGTVIVSNSNEINIANLAIADIGVYTVVMNALDGCISKGAGAMVGRNCYTVLPLDVMNFTATRKNDKAVDLYWETANETYNNIFEIERSTDGIDWVKIGQMAAKSSGGSTREKYAFVDITAGDKKAAVVYYRIKQVNANGKINYTTVRKVYFSLAFSMLKVYPSPFISSVSLDFVSDNTKNAVVSLFDMAGIEVSRSVMPVSKGINHYQYAPVLPVEAGNYVLVLTQGTNKFSQQVTKISAGK